MRRCEGKCNIFFLGQSTERGGEFNREAREGWSFAGSHTPGGVRWRRKKQRLVPSQSTRIDQPWVNVGGGMRVSLLVRRKLDPEEEASVLKQWSKEAGGKRGDATKHQGEGGKV